MNWFISTAAKWRHVALLFFRLSSGIQERYLSEPLKIATWQDVREMYSVRCSTLENFILWKKGVLKNSAIFTGKHQCCFFFNKVADLEACNFVKKRLQYRCFPVDIAKFFGAPILKNTCQRLLLPIHFSGRVWSTYVHCMNLSATHLSSLIYTGSVVYNQHFYGLYMTKDKISEVGSGTGGPRTRFWGHGLDISARGWGRDIPKSPY